MGGEENQFTVNIVDTGIFWGIGKPPGEGFSSLRSAVRTANTTLHLPQPIYEELGGDIGADSFPSGSEYVDQGLEEGWISVAERIEDDPEIQEIIDDAKYIIRKKDDYPKTASIEKDATIIGLAAQKFVRNEVIYVIIHTNDKAVAEAAIIALHEGGYTDVEANFVPPQKAKERMSDPEQFKSLRH